MGLGIPSESHVCLPRLSPLPLHTVAAGSRSPGSVPLHWLPSLTCADRHSPHPVGFAESQNSNSSSGLGHLADEWQARGDRVDGTG